jgi:hypothetical protein
VILSLILSVLLRHETPSDPTSTLPGNSKPGHPISSWPMSKKSTASRHLLFTANFNRSNCEKWLWASPDINRNIRTSFLGSLNLSENSDRLEIRLERRGSALLGSSGPARVLSYKYEAFSADFTSSGWRVPFSYRREVCSASCLKFSGEGFQEVWSQAEVALSYIRTCKIWQGGLSGRLH